MQEQLILGGSVLRTRRRAHDLQVIGKVSSRVEIRILSSKRVTGMSILRKNSCALPSTPSNILTVILEVAEESSHTSMSSYDSNGLRTKNMF